MTALFVLLKVLTMLPTVFLCHCGVDAFRHAEITVRLGTFDTVELKVLRACNTALSGGTYSEAVGGSGRLAGSTEGFLTTEVSNVLREAEAPL